MHFGILFWIARNLELQQNTTETETPKDMAVWFKDARCTWLLNTVKTWTFIFSRNMDADAPVFLVHPPKTPILVTPSDLLWDALRLNFYTTVRMKQSRYKVGWDEGSCSMFWHRLMFPGPHTPKLGQFVGPDFFPVFFSRCPSLDWTSRRPSIHI